MKKVLKGTVCALLVAGLVGVAYAQFAKTEDAIEYRQSVMVLIGHHFGQIAAMVQGKKPFDAKELQQNAALVETLSKLPLAAFLMDGSDKGKTHMKPAALKDKEDFKAHLEAFDTEAAKLAQVAAGGDLEAIKAQFGNVGKSCKACHDKYRSH
ncbi:MAG: cytochrome c [Desulfobacteraceae bacterium]|nr:cytochrome c [Desulfobacteraceae bacterium]